jgi:hypothetical protein
VGMGNQLKERDFIDLLSSLYVRKKIFYAILVFFIIIGTIFNSYYNNEFKFSFELKTPDRGSYLKYYNYLYFIDGIKLESLDNGSNPFNDNNAKIDYTNYISKKASFQMVENFKFNLAGINQLADLFLSSSYYDNSYGKSKLVNEIKSAINIKKLPGQSAIFTVTSDNKGLVIFLHNNLPSFLNKIVGNQYFEYIQSVKNNKISELRLMNAVRISHLKLKLDLIDKEIKKARSEKITNNEALVVISSPELKVLNNKRWQMVVALGLVESPEVIINTKILPKNKANYFYILSSDPSEQNKINSLFLFSFIFFVTFIFHLMIVIVIDLKDQVATRLESLT